MRDGYKVTELGEIPEEWEVVKLSDIGTVITGNTPSTKIKTYYAESDGLLWASPSDLGKQKYVTKTARILSQEGFNQTRKIPRGSILVTCIGSTIGKIGMAFEEMATNQQINSLACNSLNESNFFFYVLQSKAEYIKSLAGTQAVPLLNKSDFSNIFLSRPPLPEQQKIASILSTVDEKIEVIDEQIKQTQELKKGLMQQLLTKGIGHTKFKSSELGEIPESWEVVKLESVCGVIDPHPSHRAPKEDPAGLPFIGIGDISPSGKINLQKARRISRGDVDEQRKTFTLHEYDMGFGRVASIGKVVWFKKQSYEYAISPTMALIRPKNVDPAFAFQVLSSFVTSNQFRMVSGGSTRISIGIKNLRQLNFIFPRKSEQQKIASILSTVDEKIDSLKAKKQTCQQLKRGLMQQLLTGKVRVKIHQQETSLA